MDKRRVTASVAFETEFIALLKKHNVKFDPKYVLD
jgi:hypothetical protein